VCGFAGIAIRDQVMDIHGGEQVVTKIENLNRRQVADELSLGTFRKAESEPTSPSFDVRARLFP